MLPPSEVTVPLKVTVTWCYVCPQGVGRLSFGVMNVCGEIGYEPLLKSLFGMTCSLKTVSLMAGEDLNPGPLAPHAMSPCGEKACVPLPSEVTVTWGYIASAGQ